MSPAVLEEPGNGATKGTHAETNGHVNGLNGMPKSQHLHSQNTSRLVKCERDSVHDLVCVGFGPASLAIAVALNDALEDGNLLNPPNVLFLEKQHRFAWHAGMLLPGAKMQISFIKDLATLRNPRSSFTFLNYLNEQGRLVDFTNLSTFLPARAEYEDYLRWAASHFDDVVQYGSEVLSVARDQMSGDGMAAVTFRVSSRDPETGIISTHRAKNIIVAVGGRASIPKSLPSGNPRVIHSSQYAHLVPKTLNDSRAPYRVAVVGAGQSAAEIFNNVQLLYPNSQTRLIMRSEFLKPSDDSPL
jgi:L-ornithine N5-monooxygenase